jgi:hypothetical protein
MDVKPFRQEKDKIAIYLNVGVIHCPHRVAIDDDVSTKAPFVLELAEPQGAMVPAHYAAETKVFGGTQDG